MSTHDEETQIESTQSVFDQLKPPYSAVEKEGDTTPSSDNSSVATRVEGEEDDFPDGGLKAWSVVFGASCAVFSSFGLVNAWGVFQGYYEQTILSDTSPSTIAWIGSIQYALVFMPGLVTGRVFDIGYFRLPLFLASILLVVTTILTAECKEFWQFLLCQGFGVGISSGVVFGPTLALVGQWFKRKRSLALSLVAVGSSVGGTLLPIAARRLITEVGFQWAMRIMGFILLFSLGLANLLLRRRLPPKHVTGSLVNLSNFRNLAFNVYCLGGVIGFLGVYTMLTYLEIAAAEIGINADLAFYLISIANAGSGLGRLFSGLTADRFGVLFVMAPLTGLAGIMTYVWPFITSQQGLIAVAIFYGFSSGAFVSLLAAPLIAMGGPHDSGQRVGMGFTVFAFGAVAGPPISGAINAATGGFKFVGVYAGSCVVVCAALMVLTRKIMLGQSIGTGKA